MTWEYIAGFFDGEGTLANNGKGFRIAIPQTHEDVLKDIMRFTGVGKICLVAKRKSHWKSQWVYYIAKQKDVWYFLKRIVPYTVIKKPLIQSALPQIQVLLRRQQLRQQRFIRRIKTARALRKTGLPYWRIGQRMDLDRSYVRRLVLGILGKTVEQQLVR